MFQSLIVKAAWVVEICPCYNEYFSQLLLAKVVQTLSQHLNSHAVQSQKGSMKYQSSQYPSKIN